MSFQPGKAAAAPKTQVEVSVACRNLRDRDVLSKSDPMCVLFIKELGSNRPVEVGRTEQIKNQLNPEFDRKFVIDYYFEESQKLTFEIYDVDSPSAQLSSHDFLGRCEITLGEIVGAAGSKVHRQLTGIHGKLGTILISAEEVGSSKDVAYIQFKGVKLDKKDFLGKSDPFLQIFKQNDDGRTLVHRTEVIKNNLNPVWKPFKSPLRQLCSEDENRSIFVECYDYDNDGGHDLIGICTVTLKQLKSPAAINTGFDLINEKKQKKHAKSYKNSGQLFVMSCSIVEEHSFLDYIRGGTQINFTVAVDFTASNGNPGQPTSLHYIHPYQPNQYMIALKAVGEICQDYDSDKLFPALGFGAKLPPQGVVSHEFYLNFTNDPHCRGIDGVIAAYRQAIMSVQLYGPTNFSPVINHVAKFAAAAHNVRAGSNYFVLLIITDGIISDMENTKAAIVNASYLPMSIIIVGVGNEEFVAMEELDADRQRLSYNGRYADRDIVQFVAFREYQTGDPQMSQARLAKDVLAEIPTQLTGYMHKNGIKAKPPLTVSAEQLPPPPQQQIPPPTADANLYPSTQQQQNLPQQPVLPGYPSAPGYPSVPPQGQQPPYPSQPGYPQQQQPYPSQSGYPAVPAYQPQQQQPPSYQPNSQSYQPGYPPPPAFNTAATPVYPGYPPTQPRP